MRGLRARTRQRAAVLLVRCRVAASARRACAERVVGAGLGLQEDDVMAVEIEDHVIAVLVLCNGLTRWDGEIGLHVTGVWAATVEAPRCWTVTV